MEYMNYECLKSKGFFYLQFKGPKIFWCTKLFIYSNESDFEDIFSFLLLFHEFRVYPSERLLVVKVSEEQRFPKVLLHFWLSRSDMCSYTVQRCCCFCLFLHLQYMGIILRQCWYRIAIYLIVIPDKYMPVRLVSCVCMCVSVSLFCLSLFSRLNALRSVEIILIGMTLPWHEKLSVVRIYWLISDFWNIWNLTTQWPNNSKSWRQNILYLTVSPRFEMQRWLLLQ